VRHHPRGLGAGAQPELGAGHPHPVSRAVFPATTTARPTPKPSRRYRVPCQWPAGCTFPGMTRRKVGGGWLLLCRRHVEAVQSQRPA
jgi:hypothetical protein